ncbi:MAG: GAF domain-containing protein [Thiobacillaceae bacterium]
MQPNLAKLRELVAYEPDCPFEDALYAMTRLTGEMLSAGRVSLMLRDMTRERQTRLRLVALYGTLPDAAWGEDAAEDAGIAGRVLASGRPLRVEDIAHSEFSTQARRPDASASFMACPVMIAGQAAGVLNISEPALQPCFSEADMELAELAALVIGNAIQRMRLSSMLDSRFAQMALTLEGQGDSQSMTRLTAHDPERVARMLAKAFYKEMHHCGFTPNQIIHAAGEIISELTGSLNRHKQRLARKT